MMSDPKENKLEQCVSTLSDSVTILRNSVRMLTDSTSEFDRFSKISKIVQEMDIYTSNELTQARDKKIQQGMPELEQSFSEMTEKVQVMEECAKSTDAEVVKIVENFKNRDKTIAKIKHLKKEVDEIKSNSKKLAQQKLKNEERKGDLERRLKEARARVQNLTNSKPVKETMILASEEKSKEQYQKLELKKEKLKSDVKDYIIKIQKLKNKKAAIEKAREAEAQVPKLKQKDLGILREFLEKQADKLATLPLPYVPSNRFNLNEWLSTLKDLHQQVNSLNTPDTETDAEDTKAFLNSLFKSIFEQHALGNTMCKVVDILYKSNTNELPIEDFSQSFPSDEEQKHKFFTAASLLDKFGLLEYDVVYDETMGPEDSMTSFVENPSTITLLKLKFN